MDEDRVREIVKEELVGAFTAGQGQPVPHVTDDNVRSWVQWLMAHAFTDQKAPMIAEDQGPRGTGS
jgi:hypothetical protein